MVDVKLHADRFLRKVSPSYRVKRKHQAEIAHWKDELLRLSQWFRDSSVDWWGIKPPNEQQKLKNSDLWEVNAVMTMHSVRPSYHEELRLAKDEFVGKRVLEIGSGPLAPLLQFENCERHCIDPLVNMYLEAGWPLFAYDAKFISTGGERLPYPDEYFDVAISVNALDHVDDFERVASEMQRVLKRGGKLYIEVEYHAPTVAEPIVLDDKRVIDAFANCRMHIAIKRSGKEMFTTLAERYGLLKNQFERFDKEVFVTFHGVKQ
ncbi:methyltransferase domain-containing protein [Rhizobium phaseoli]|jgi:ubiquinone/menaquinone biosynthesis C-methylase UbiE|uniref:Methyltransferase domain-containing protein n=1 Tax=Rhizobium phaseoli TaxID=396 RepID=A0A7K3UDP0_9HYPH|nr:class I SAM-dependent methyltransferase [Rhizobium phaseoli]NEJ71770.1 methyltransferase domain-containing protein [Rhizobium phaseoli]